MKTPASAKLSDIIAALESNRIEARRIATAALSAPKLTGFAKFVNGYMTVCLGCFAVDFADTFAAAVTRDDVVVEIGDLITSEERATVMAFGKNYLSEELAAV